MENDKLVDKYFAAAPEKYQKILTAMRESIHILLPEGEERFAYQIAVYHYKGKPLFSLAYFKDHCSFIVQVKDIDKIFPKELAGFKISGTTIHFDEKKPLPEETLIKLIAFRKASRD
jgi:uncharacterized protein YdhG (YjbR/CyaY superfamily)